MIDFRRESAVTHPTEGMPPPVLFPSQKDHDTQRPYRLYDYTESQTVQPPLFLQGGRESQHSADTL